MQITLRDIAKESGYSVTTVSRALAGYDDVNAQTREHILTIAAELGYQPNMIARQLRSQHTQTIGFIIPTGMSGMDDDFFSILLKGISQTAARNQYDLLISTQLPESNPLDAYRRIVGGKRVDGVIVARTSRDDPRIEYLKSINFPFVVSGRNAPDQVSDFPYLDVDSQYGIRLMVEHFISYGHQHIGLILPPPNLAYTAYRLQGYKDGLQKAALPFRENYVVTGDLQRDSGYQAGQQLLSNHPEITAIVACNDLMALGSMTAVQEGGLTVGTDIAIGGFDDIPLAEHAHPALTTLHQPIFEIGEALTTILLQIIQKETPVESQILWKPALKIRGSSGRPRLSVHM